MLSLPTIPIPTSLVDAGESPAPENGVGKRKNDCFLLTTELLKQMSIDTK